MDEEERHCNLKARDTYLQNDSHISITHLDLYPLFHLTSNTRFLSLLGNSTRVLFPLVTSAIFIFLNTNKADLIEGLPVDKEK